MIDRIHHINFLVRDLDAAVARYQAMLGSREVIYEDLPRRGVATARFRVGQAWVVLLQPYDDTGVPGRYLARHGEGFFLISYGTGDLEAECDRIAESGITVVDESPRQGLDNWRVRDLFAEDLFGVCTQIAESDD